MNLRTVIVDDEDLAIDLLCHFFKSQTEFELLKTFTNSKNALSFINEHQPEVLFLDIQMPLLNGIHLIENLNYSPITVLVTAYSEFAQKAYDLEVVDYLLKPYTKDRFLKSLEKIKQYSNFKLNNQNKIENNCFFVKHNGLQKKINFNEILFIEGLKQYVRIITKNDKYILLGSMKNFEDQLQNHLFIRIHKSYIVNLKKVNALIGNSIKIENFKLPVGRNYKSNLKLISQELKFE